MHDPLYPGPNGDEPPSSSLLPDLSDHHRARLLTAGAAAMAMIAALALFTTLRQHPADDDVAAAPATTTMPAGPPAPTVVSTTDSYPPPTPPQDRIGTFVQDFYAKLPGQSASAWDDFDQHYAARIGRASFDQFWAGIRSVEVLSVAPRDANSVDVVLRYRTVAGATDTERRWISVVTSGDRLLVYDSERIGTA